MFWNIVYSCIFGVLLLTYIYRLIINEENKHLCGYTCLHKMTVLTGHLKILRGCRIHNDNNYTNDVNRGLLNSLSIPQTTFRRKVTSSSHKFLSSLLLLSYMMPNLHGKGLTGHWIKLHPIVSFDTIPVSRSSKRLKELVSLWVEYSDFRWKVEDVSFTWNVGIQYFAKDLCEVYHVHVRN